MIRRNWLSLLQGKKQRRLANRNSVARGSAAAVESLETRELLAAFTPGNLVVYRVGDGSAALGNAATAAFLDEYTTAGTLVQSIALPTTENDTAGQNGALNNSGSATSHGFINLSTNGQYITVAGYNAALGTTSVATSALTFERTIGLVDLFGNVNSTTKLGDAYSSNFRSVVSDGTNFWTAGNGSSTDGGVRYVSGIGSSTSTQLATTPTNLRNLGIFGGQLYSSTQSGTFRLATVGTGIPTTNGQTITNLPGFSTTTGSPYSYFFADLSSSVAGVDTLYVADDSGTTNLQKYSLVSGSWTANGTVSLAGARGLTAVVSGSTVTLYATSATSLQTLTDSTGYNATIGGTFTSLATAGTNTAFRGVAWAPTSMFGTSGDDTFAITAATGGANISLNGGAAVFVSTAQLATFTINGSGGNDTFNIAGGLALGSIFGGEGNDTFNLGAASTISSLDGGNGTDTLDYSAYTTVVTVNLSTNSATGITTLVAASGTSTIENVNGGTNNDVITGNNLANVLQGNGGNDNLTGLDGNDTLVGGLGNDQYIFDADVALGSDTITEAGGGGTDLINYQSTTTIGVNLNASLTGAQTINANHTLTLGTSAVENLWGGSGNDTLQGNSLNNFLIGFGGADTYVFDADTAQGTDSVNDNSGANIISFAPTAANTTINLATTGAAQVVATGLLSINLIAGTTFDQYIGGTGNDTVTTSTAYSLSSLSSGDGDDFVTVNSDSVTLVGTVTTADLGIGNDLINIVNGRVLNVQGGTGNDRFLLPVSSTVTSLDGGAGSDTLDYGIFSGAITVNLASAYGTITATAITTLVSTAGVASVENVTGGFGDDSISGSDGDNIIYGGIGNDTIYGRGGSDTLGGDSDNDTFVMAVGATVASLDGGDGLDTLDYSAFATGVTVRLSSNLDYGTISATGITTLVATAGDANVENVTGGTGNDVLAGTDGANILIGGGGNDLLYARGGNDTLNGGAGNDNYYFRTRGAGLQTKVLTELSGSDYLHFGAVTNNLNVDLTASGLQTVATGELALNFTGTDFENVWGGSGSDIITGNALANVIFGNGGGDTLSGGDGNDTIYGGANNDFIFGGNDNDTLVGDDGIDTISGDAGNDTLDGRAGNDTLTGGIGNDVLRGGTGNDSLDGGADNDSIIGEAGDDSLTGGAGDDVYSFFAPVGTESDSITGESGGTDTIFFAASVTQNVTLQLNIAAGAQNVITGTNSLTLSLNGVQFERVTGGSGNDIIIGNASANILTGGAGNDVLVGLAGNDTLSGGEGDDVLIGGLGGDVLNGLGGSDLLVAGESSVQTNVASLLAIQTAWSDGSAYASRQAAVTPLLGTLTDNNVFDRLTGGTEQDLFFAQLADLVTDLVGGENRVTI